MPELVVAVSELPQRYSEIPDCRGRRLIALADAVREGNKDAIEQHLLAVDLWHRKTLIQRFTGGDY